MAEEKLTATETTTPPPATPDIVSTTPIIEDEGTSHLAPIIGVLIIMLVLILGGLYLWGRELSKGPAAIEIVPREIENNEPETTRAEADAEILQTTSTSDEIAAIEADIESTELDTLDAELEEIDRELEAALQ